MSGSSSYTPSPTPSRAFQAIRTPPPVRPRDTGTMAVTALAAGLDMIERVRAARLRIERLASD